MASAQQFGQQGGQQPIAILRQSGDVAPDGSYAYSYETQNGIVAGENGALGARNAEGEQAVVAQGQYQYTAPDGTPITVTYTADENGFRAQGAHLPVAPAIPAQIQRALEYIAAHPAKPESQQQQRRPF